MIRLDRVRDFLEQSGPSEIMRDWKVLLKNNCLEAHGTPIFQKKNWQGCKESKQGEAEV